MLSSLLLFYPGKWCISSDKNQRTKKSEEILPMVGSFVNDVVAEGDVGDVKGISLIEEFLRRKCAKDDWEKQRFIYFVVFLLFWISSSVAGRT